MRAQAGVAPANIWRTGMWFGVAASAMMFIGLTSAYIVSQGLGPAWEQIHIRPLIWVNTAILAASSFVLERGLRGRNSVLGAAGLGLLFLCGQLAVFRQLQTEGYYLNTGRQSSFFYVLTGLHGLHVLGGLLALGWLAWRISRDGSADPQSTARFRVVSIFWHFMGVLWLYLLAVLFL